MLTGVEILLERMKTNPDEFVDGAYSKWGRVMAMGREFFTEEERSALDVGLIGARREAFNGEVLRVLTGNATEQTTAGSLYATNLSAAITTTSNAFNTAPSKIIAPSSMAKQAKEILNAQFDKEYAKQKGE